MFEKWVDQTLYSSSVLPFKLCIHHFNYRNKNFIIGLFVSASNYNNSPISLVWIYYCEHLSLANKEYVLSVYHDKFIKLPWEEFFPDLSSIEYMIKVCVYFTIVCYHGVC